MVLFSFLCVVVALVLSYLADDWDPWPVGLGTLAIAGCLFEYWSGRGPAPSGAERGTPPPRALDFRTDLDAYVDGRAVLDDVVERWRGRV